MDIFDHNDEWTAGGERLEQPTDGPRRIRGRRLTDPQDVGEAIAYGHAVGFCRQELAKRGRDRLGVTRGACGRLCEQLDERCEGDAVAVRGVCPTRTSARLANSVGEIRGEARLTHAWGAENGDQYACTRVDRVLQRAVKCF